ncbi:MAG: AMP-binding protein [Actinomycetes bacterium]
MARLVALRLPPGPAFLAELDRAWEAGDAVLPLPVDTPAADLGRTLATLRPARLVHGTGASDLFDPLEVPDGTALVVATSGSTGEPKGVLLTRRALDASVQASIARLGCAPRERWLGVLPVHHVAGITVALRSRALGVEADLRPTLDLEHPSDARWVSLVPTQLVRVLEAGVPDWFPRWVLLGGAAAPAALLERADAAGLVVTTSYGMTETCGGCVYDGRPLDGVRVELADDGRIRIAGAVLASGYHRAPERWDEAVSDGWFTTADRGRLLDDGRLEVLGRTDDVVVSGGENVSTASVAGALRSLPEIADAAVVGLPDDEWGEVVGAVVVAAADATVPDVAVVRDRLRERLPRHALPRRLVVVASIPRDELGKVPATTLRRLLDG